MAKTDTFSEPGLRISVLHLRFDSCKHSERTHGQVPQKQEN